MTSPPPSPVAHAIFLSWCSADAKDKDDLIARLTPNLANLTGLDLSWWEMSQLRPGDEFEPSILARLVECDSGLQLVSPGWAASPFIRTHETPVFVGPGASRMALPVGLRRVPMGAGSMDLQGIDKLQLHLYQGKFYSELRGANRDAFAQSLALRIRERILGVSPWRRITRP